MNDYFPLRSRCVTVAGMKLAQNQVWKTGDEYLRIVHLERLEVQYKAIKDLVTGEGKRHHVSKKEFCRLLKGATLLTQDDLRGIWTTPPTAPAA